MFSCWVKNEVENHASRGNFWNNTGTSSRDIANWIALLDSTRKIGLITLSNDVLIVVESVSALGFQNCEKLEYLTRTSIATGRSINGDECGLLC